MKGTEPSPPFVVLLNTRTQKCNSHTIERDHVDNAVHGNHVPWTTFEQKLDKLGHRAFQMHRETNDVKMDIYHYNKISS
jgi:hypothetical protein